MLLGMDIDQIDVYGNGNSLGYIQSLAEKRCIFFITEGLEDTI